MEIEPTRDLSPSLSVVLKTGVEQRITRRKSFPDKDRRPNSTNKQPPLDPILRRDNRQADADLAAVVGAWDRLPEAVRAAIVTMAKVASGK
jgi:hypothetical protein